MYQELAVCLEGRMRLDYNPGKHLAINDHLKTELGRRQMFSLEYANETVNGLIGCVRNIDQYADLRSFLTELIKWGLAASAENLHDISLRMTKMTVTAIRRAVGDLSLIHI